MKTTTGYGGLRPSTALWHSGSVTVSDSLIGLDGPASELQSAAAPPLPPPLLLLLSVRGSFAAVVSVEEPFARAPGLDGRHQ